MRDLTEASEGNAIGIGDADFTTHRLAEKTDLQKTAVNCITSCCPEAGRIPLTYASDREAIAAALLTIRPYTLNDLRIVHIKNTLMLDQLVVSDGCLAEINGRAGIRLEPEALRLTFDENENLCYVPVGNPG